MNYDYTETCVFCQRVASKDFGAGNGHAVCDKCGPFTGAVHVVDEDVLFAEGKKHENDCKND